MNTYPHFYNSKEKITSWLREHRLTDYEIVEDNTYGYIVNCFANCSYNYIGTVNLSNKNLCHLPVKFGKVKGHFLIAGNKLDTLEGCPDIVTGDFNCSRNDLTSLRHSPSIVEGSYYCSYNKLRSLQYITQSDIKNFKASYNILTDLEYLPEVRGYLHCDNNELEHIEQLLGCVLLAKKSYGQEVVQALNLKNNPLLGRFQEVTNLIELEKCIMEREIQSISISSRINKI